MSTAQKSKSTAKSKIIPRGLLANRSCGAWQVDIDGALSGEQHWMQIEGATASFCFEISTLDIVGKMAEYLAPTPAKSPRLANGSTKKPGLLALGGSDVASLSLVKDDEFDDRFYFVIGPVEAPTVRVVIPSADVSDLAAAARQTAEDLENDS